MDFFLIHEMLIKLVKIKDRKRCLDVPFGHFA